MVSALIDGERTTGINLIELSDHEEVGSSTKQGAASILLHDMVKRIVKGLGGNLEDDIHDLGIEKVFVAFKQV